jgi:hypothetical protein
MANKQLSRQQEQWREARKAVELDRLARSRRDRNIAEARFGRGESFQEIAAHHDLSTARVQQIAQLVLREVVNLARQDAEYAQAPTEASVMALRMSHRAYWLLRSIGVETVGQFFALSDGDLRDLGASKNCGRVTLDEMLRVHSAGVPTGHPLQPWQIKKPDPKSPKPAADVHVNPSNPVDANTPEGRAQLLAEGPPTTVGEQLDRLRELANDPAIDPQNAADISGALWLVEHHRRILARDMDPAAAQRLDQLIVQASLLGAAHQRIYDRLRIEKREGDKE